MFCIKCGAENKETAAFCRKCGEATGVDIEAVNGDTEIETRVAARDDVPTSDALRMRELEPETMLFSITPTMMFVKAGYVATAIAAFLLVGVASAFLWTIVPIWLAVVFGLALFAIPAYFHIRQKLVRYTLTETKLEIDEGFISRTTRSVPLRRIQDVTVSASAAQRLLGFGDLMIDNASEDGGKVVLKDINSPREYADLLMRQMRRLEN